MSEMGYSIYVYTPTEEQLGGLNPSDLITVRHNYNPDTQYTAASLILILWMNSLVSRQCWLLWRPVSSPLVP